MGFLLFVDFAVIFLALRRIIKISTIGINNHDLMNNTAALNALTSLGTIGAGGNKIDSAQFLAVAGGLGLFFILFIIWSLVWKALALWYAARRGEKGWFIALMVLNTLGILEIVYIFAVAKHSDVLQNKPVASVK